MDDMNRVGCEISVYKIGGRWHMTEMNGKQQFWMCKHDVALIQTNQLIQSDVGKEIGLQCQAYIKQFLSFLMWRAWMCCVTDP